MPSSISRSKCKFVSKFVEALGETGVVFSGFVSDGIRDYECPYFVLSFKTLKIYPFDSYSLCDSVGKGTSSFFFYLFSSLRNYSFHRMALHISVLLNSSSDLPGHLLNTFIFRMEVIFLTVVLC